MSHETLLGASQENQEIVMAAENQQKSGVAPKIREEVFHALDILAFFTHDVHVIIFHYIFD